MRRVALRALRWPLRGVAALLGAVALYLALAWVLGRVPVNEGGAPGPYTVYLRSNGVHTDLVLPVRSGAHDWRTLLDPAHAARPDTLAEWIAFGWGDKGFYLETPTWAELKASTAVKAAFGLSGSAMHITWMRTPVEGPQCRRFTLAPEAMAQLVAYVRSGFAPGTDGLPMRIANAHYEATDVFYEGTGRYHVFGTCNSWTNRGLKACGARACLWTPFQGALMDLYAPE